MLNLKRKMYSNLLFWQKSSTRKPLLLRGARQVGKSSLVEAFGAAEFGNVFVVNFELEPQYLACFESLDPAQICNALSILKQQPIVPGQTLLFLDEIQICPRAIMALRYFKEKMPELHVIAAGSQLEFTLKQKDFRMPVGRVESMYLYPLSFSEYLHNANPQAAEAITQATLKTALPEALHQHLLMQLKQYLFLGGMPEVVADYLQYQRTDNVQKIQADILNTYENDLGHYATTLKLQALKTCFRRVPLMVGQQIKYNKIDPEFRSRELKEALMMLQDAGIVHRIHASSATGLPLETTVNEKKFKLNFVDVGLVKKLDQLDADLLLSDDVLLLNKGAIAEQFVGQELLAYAPHYELHRSYFWAKDDFGTAEVDYLAVMQGQVFPLEVKAGKIGRLRSLTQFLETRCPPFGIRVSQAPLEMQGQVLSVPLYLLSELPRLVSECL